MTSQTLLNRSLVRIVSVFDARVKTDGRLIDQMIVDKRFPVRQLYVRDRGRSLSLPARRFPMVSLDTRIAVAAFVRGQQEIVREVPRAV